ncbi:AsmA family protein [Marinobacter zhanjiangensis]|uniref:Cell envelope biogenesis protein AsmA n=1 Tax=Marinobacter zhanjiangensis TaxID=578215 RepID=A0ABQ3BA11_9GAMM|nr:AsmA family protein [Marinobacter zhanjiangensis]GGY80629.1 cell envelope biogenesis protein AsmA [Marinobacter zhanjiangensis]
MKAVRYVIFTVIGLIVLAAAAVAIAIFAIDPNTYKPQIERVVEQKTNLDLELSGDISWSIFPLGLELNEVEATLEGERFVALRQLVARVDFWSLISMSPQVHTFVLDGLDARLVVSEDGTGNWTRILPEGETPTADDAAEQQTDEDGEPASDVLAFAVEEVRITDASVQYEDQATGQSIVLQNFRVLASQIALGSEFPLEVGFLVNTSQPNMGVDGDITMRLTANEALNQFAVSGLDAKFGLSGEPFDDKTIQARINGSATANLENETASLEDFRATLANLEITTNLNVEGFGAQPQVSGNLEVAEFSLRELMSTLGAEEIQTTDPEVLNSLSLSTKLTGPAGVAELSELKMVLDDTTFTGGARYNIESGAFSFQLDGDALNADRYLPPPAEEGSQESSGDAPATAGAEGDLLPLETLRGLDLDIDLGLGELIISNLTITNINTAIDASGGQLSLSNFSGNLYGGGFQSDVNIDARSDDPTWRLQARVSDVETQPLLQDLAELDMLAGAANVNINANTRGNRISILRESADGEVTFNLAEGQFTRMNLTRMACRGIALVNQEELTTDDWGQTTPFNDMQGTLDINGNTLNNTSLVAALAGMRLEGNGTVDMAASEIDYEAGLRIVGEIHRDEACRVTEYVENVVIPVECRGNFAEDPAGICSFDGSRFRDTLKDIAANAARAKVQEETDRARERVEEKAREKIDERLQGEDGDKVKDALRGLLNR